MASRSACRSSRDTRARPLAGWPARYRPPAPPAARPAPRPLPPLARQRGVDKAVLDRKVPLDRQFLRRDQFDDLGDFGAECGGDAGCHLCVIGGVWEEQADRAEGQRQTNLKPHALRNDAFLLQLAEDEMRADRVFRVAEPPARIAEAHLRDAEPDAELELAVHPQGPPTLDAVRIGGRPAQRFDLRMAVENAVGNAVDPVSAVADFAVGHIGDIGPKGTADTAENLFRRIERNAANQQ